MLGRPGLAATKGVWLGPRLRPAGLGAPAVLPLGWAGVFQSEELRAEPVARATTGSSKVWAGPFPRRFLLSVTLSMDRQTLRTLWTLLGATPQTASSLPWGHGPQRLAHSPVRSSGD